ncbi:MAG: RagB/SusD family nutrient uptake outer membrane protein [Muribaculaceae bacterium]|nr:RagB/SusD family nutrient uptake outer membrane protein [Muribaculaceae bacterium]
MNKIYKYLLAAALVPAMASCLDETVPTGGTVTGSQVADADKVGLANAVAQTLNSTFNSNQHWDIGYPALMIHRDAMTSDMPVHDIGYYYYADFGLCLYLDDRQSMYDMYNTYYQIILRANKLLEVCNDEREDDAPHLVTGLTYRALCYLDMMRLWEYRPTGIAGLDAEAEGLGIAGLTVPIVNENTSETKGFNNPRAPFYKMYRFILSDLNRAEAVLPYVGAQPLNHGSRGVVYGMKARLWLEIATRARRFPADLAEMIAHDGETYDAEEDLGAGYALDPLGITTATQAYQNAARYARLAINCGYTPTTRDEWFNPKTGFNTATSGWMWCIMMGKSDPMVISNDWKSWVGMMCPEANYGVSSSSYGSYHMIDAAFFTQISKSDWRRDTWIDPNDAGDENAYNTKYAKNNNFTYDEWRTFSEHTGIKFHPAQGERRDSKTGNQVDIPLMRVEEMYLIEAEALGFAEGIGSGKQALESFINTYRYTDGSYTSPAANLEEFARNVVLQKRIEFWGEGIVIWDMTRLGLPVTRGYTGTNHPVSYRFNSLDGYVPAWTNIFISMTERDQNQACLPNPNPTPYVTAGLWSE